MTDRAVTLLVLLAAASLAWWLLSRRDGRFRPAAPGARAGDVLEASDVGGSLTGHATFVLVSSATCSTCPQVRRVLSAIADGEPGVSFRELPAESHMALVRRLDVLRTPTVLLLDERGTVRSRTSGPLRADQARAALAQLTAGRPTTEPTPALPPTATRSRS